MPLIPATAVYAIVICAAVGIAAAQNFPTRPITLIVPFTAGGTTDVTARIVAEHMSRTLGQQVVIENIGGAGGTIGTARAMRASPDGYTIVMGQMGTHAAAVALYPNLAYKPDADFEPIGLASAIPAIIVARKDFPANDLRTFAAYVKTNADKLNVAHAGVGSVFFTTGLLLNSILGVKPTMVPFNGGAPAMSAIVGGQVDYMSADVPMRGRAAAGRRDQGFRGRDEDAQSRAAGRPDRRGGRPSRIPGVGVERPVRAEVDAGADPRKARGRARQGARRPRHAQAPARSRLRNPRQGEPRPASPRGARQERDRAMDADPPRGTRDGELEGAANAGQAVFRAVLVGLWLSCVMAGLVPATPIVRHRPCQGYRGRRDKPGDDGA